jgi:hypothetical protein
VGSHRRSTQSDAEHTEAFDTWQLPGSRLQRPTQTDRRDLVRIEGVSDKLPLETMSLNRHSAGISGKLETDRSLCWYTALATQANDLRTFLIYMFVHFSGSWGQKGHARVVR